MEANISFCTGSGGHLWWGNKLRRPDLNTPYLLENVLGPDDDAMDVTLSIYDFICEHGHECEHSTGAKISRKKNLKKFLGAHNTTAKGNGTISAGTYAGIGVGAVGAGVMALGGGG